MEIRILDVVTGADNSCQGGDVFDRISIALSLSQSGAVEVSFNGLDTATLSFVNAAFLPLKELYSPAQMKARLRVVDSRREINDILTRLGPPFEHLRGRVKNPGREYMKKLQADLQKDPPQQEPEHSRYRGIDRGGR
jgi:hypothetical protein